MKTIKFRGIAVTGEAVYGDLAHWRGHVYIDEKRVNPETVAQLCGYDANGDEIYEGDSWYDADGGKYTAQIRNVVHSEGGMFPLEIVARLQMRYAVEN